MCQHERKSHGQIGYEPVISPQFNRLPVYTISQMN